MKQLIIAEGYKSTLTLRETQKAIKFVKDNFQTELKNALGLERISAPLFVEKGSGVNDDLNGVERKVEFDIKESGQYAEVVQSLAKWKRMALKQYGFSVGEGLYTDMSAIRRDDDVDNLHSIYVDQWDWEKVISAKDRNVEYLKETVRKIVLAVYSAKQAVKEAYPALKGDIEKDVFFITSQELEDMFPNLTSKERETAITKEYKTVFIIGIGYELKSGKKHDGRAPDYDDWNLNGDLLFWDDILNMPIEISSMGIRVDSKSLKKQLAHAGAEDRMQYPYHQGVASGKLPLTIGGGIGQSRLCILLLEKMHVGEVQSSVWPPEMRAELESRGINLL